MKFNTEKDKNQTNGSNWLEQIAWAKIKFHRFTIIPNWRHRPLATEYAKNTTNRHSKMCIIMMIEWNFMIFFRNVLILLNDSFLLLVCSTHHFCLICLTALETSEIQHDLVFRQFYTSNSYCFESFFRFAETMLMRTQNEWKHFQKGFRFDYSDQWKNRLNCR